MSYLYNSSVNANVYTSGLLVSNANPFPVTVSTPVTITGNVEIANEVGTYITTTHGDDAQLGAFGRLRVTDATTIGSFKTIYGVQVGPTEFNNVTNGASTITFVPNSACYNVSVNTVATDYAIRQTKQYHSYKAGCGQAIFATAVLAPTKNNLTQRVGYFDDRNGIYFEHANNNVGTTTVSWNIRSSVGNVTATSETAAQTSWNIDKFNGAGPSGINLDFTKSQIFVIDFQWLGVGRVRCGFDIDGIVYYAHEFLHSNRTSGVYMSTPSLPVRWEIRNTGVTTSASTMQAICASVLSEGGTEEQSFTFTASTGNTGVVCSTGTQGVIAFRLKNSYGAVASPNRLTAKCTGYSLFGTQSASYTIYQLANVAQISGTPTWTSENPYSGVEYTTNFSLISGFAANSFPINGGFIATAQGSAVGSTTQLISSKKAAIYQNYDSTDSQIIALVATRIGNQDSTIYAAFDFLEIV